MVQTVGAVVRNTELIADSEKVMTEVNDDDDGDDVNAAAQYLDSEEYGDLVRDNHDVVRNVRGAFTPHKLRCVQIVCR